VTEPQHNPHFISAESWEAAADELTFIPVEPAHTAGHSLQSISIHVRDHRMRELPIGDRSFEAHFGAFVVSQQQAPDEHEARRRAVEQSYGLEPREGVIAGHAARMYELGPETPPDDPDGRSPAVVVWADGDVFHLIASGQLAVAELVRIAESIY
jgi:hypothetical protein